MYLSSTEIAVETGAKAMSVMTAYGTVNGVPDCEDAYLLQDVLRNMWNYTGVVITDWGGNYDFTTDDGVTIETPNSSRNSPEVLQEALDNGLITWDYIDQQVTYILQTLAECGYLNLVYVGRQGVAVDNDPPMLIELPGL
jgi:beta-glucosidase